MSKVRYNFTDKVAFITGAGSGIGQMIAINCAQYGARVIVVDKNAQAGINTVNIIKNNRGEAKFFLADISIEDDVKNAIAFAVDSYHIINFAINNAGIEGARAPIAEYPKQEWDKVIAVNLTGVYLCMRHEIQQMLKQGFGAIVNIASIGGLIAIPNIGGYVASKHGVIGLTKQAAIEVATKGIRVNAVAPGLINIGLTDRVSQEFKNQIVSGSAIGRMGEANEIAAAVLWLCSEESSFMIGQTLVLDGGYTVI